MKKYIITTLVVVTVTLAGCAGGMSQQQMEMSQQQMEMMKEHINDLQSHISDLQNQCSLK